MYFISEAQLRDHIYDTHEKFAYCTFSRMVPGPIIICVIRAVGDKKFYCPVRNCGFSTFEKGTMEGHSTGKIDECELGRNITGL